MKILVAAELGMCFGVRDALAATRAIASPEDVTIHGELVHNGAVLRELDGRGFHRSPEDDRPLPTTSHVLLTAHGVSDRERARLLAGGKVLIDTTCPLVQKAHEAARTLAEAGRRVLVIGKRDHVEVRGLTGDLPDAIVLQNPGDVETWPDRRLGVICQTTTPVDHASAIRRAITVANPRADIEFVDTICAPTKARIAALDALLEQVEVLVAVGGKGSNNTRALATKARLAGLIAYHVEGPDELREEWFVGHRMVGLTAGTSTLDSTIAAVRARLEDIAATISR
ncbi:MAG: 4-hydroxy-3-methylbut-2-enyl diphosphate reductase [bacterium]|nr:4-hydroxy-3-methylbut-2-enyl diphosphate reductase [bacterium]